MKSKVVLVVVFYTYLCSNRVASIPSSEDSARYLRGAYPTSGLRPSFDIEKLADFFSQNLAAQYARNQRYYENRQNLYAHPTYGQDRVYNFQKEVPQSSLKQNQFQGINSYHGINQGSIGNPADLQKSQSSNVLPQNPAQKFPGFTGINNHASFQNQQPLFGVYQQPSTVSQNNLNNQQFLENFPGNGYPVPTGNVQHQNRYAVNFYPEQRIEYKTLEPTNRQFLNPYAVNDRQELTTVSRTPFPVPNTDTQITPMFTATKVVFPAVEPTPIPIPTPSTPTFTSVPAPPTPVPTATTASDQELEPLSPFDIYKVIALTRQFSENAAKQARVKATPEINAPNSNTAPEITSTSANTDPVTSSLSETSATAASQTSSSVAESVSSSSTTASATCSQTAAAPVIKSGRNGGVSWFSTADPNWLTTLLGGANNGHVYFVMAPTSDASLNTTD